jgi:polyisoprenoid-binding protein YceI
MPWQLDPTHSSISFSGKHMLVATVRGQFRSWQVDANIDEANLANSNATVRIDATSVDTGVEQRDNHLRSADFFDAENHPEILFQVKRVEPKGEEYRLVGDLTIRGITREVALDGEIDGPIDDPWGGKRVGLSAEGKLNRKDWGLDWNVPLSAGGILVSEQIKFTIDAELVKAA